LTKSRILGFKFVFNKTGQHLFLTERGFFGKKGGTTFFCLAPEHCQNLRRKRFAVCKMNTLKRTRRSFTASQKLSILAQYASAPLKKAVLDVHHINRSMIAKWTQLKPKLDACSKKKTTRKFGCGRRPTNINSETKVASVIQERRKQGLVVTRNTVKALMRQETLVSNPNFKASSGWLRGFMARHNFTIRKVTNWIHLPSRTNDAKSSLRQTTSDSFHEFVKRNSPSSDDLIINMDETPIWQDTAYSTTIETKGKPKVVGLNSGGEKKRFTAVLACTKSGMKLPPLIITKGTTKRNDSGQVSGEFVDDSFYIVQQENAYMTSDIMCWWLRNVLGPFISTRASPSTTSETPLLVLDAFSAHKTATVKEELRRQRVVPAVIPAGMTSTLQPLDIGINRAVKAKLRELWLDRIGSTVGNKPRCSSASVKGHLGHRQDIGRWVNMAWSYIPYSIITRSFAKAGI
jgi:DDE superfamily endonuclease/Tc5 transposase DNA-binding domain